MLDDVRWLDVFWIGIGIDCWNGFKLDIIVTPNSKWKMPRVCFQDTSSMIFCSYVQICNCSIYSGIAINWNRSEQIGNYFGTSSLFAFFKGGSSLWDDKQIWSDQPNRISEVLETKRGGYVQRGSMTSQNAEVQHVSPIDLWMSHDFSGVNETANQFFGCSCCCWYMISKHPKESSCLVAQCAWAGPVIWWLYGDTHANTIRYLGAYHNLHIFIRNSAKMDMCVILRISVRIMYAQLLIGLTPFHMFHEKRYVPSACWSTSHCLLFITFSHISVFESNMFDQFSHISEWLFCWWNHRYVPGI